LAHIGGARGTAVAGALQFFVDLSVTVVVFAVTRLVDRGDLTETVGPLSRRLADALTDLAETFA